ncbi:hypothetical protein D6D01_09835 [Aureobasidium pullulans]|uniref:Uncharacterized protein n=1 Tax=Aureobasidium pullulans TaxID=5580 RepID=A0A4S9JW35_AURPU|nr:hypothetical protein D6D01_09835 [Aureobasidium pullulans]
MSEPPLTSLETPPAKRIKVDVEDADTDAVTGRDEHTSELHVCTVSWPLLRAATMIQPIAHKLNKELALGLPNAREAEHLTIVLINLKSDLNTMHVFGTPEIVSRAAVVTDPELSVSSQATTSQFRLSAIHSIELNPSHEPPQAARSFAILWDHTINPDKLKPGLKRAMNRAKTAGVHLPSRFQKLKREPRQMNMEQLLHGEIRA